MNLRWVRVSRCDHGQCVEVARGPDGVYVRDSKLGDASPVLGFTNAEWEAFVAGVKRGEVDLAATPGR